MDKIHVLEGQLVFLQYCDGTPEDKRAEKRRILRLLRKQQRRDARGRRRDRLYAK
jgi:hypothetical protein